MQHDTSPQSSDPMAAVTLDPQTLEDLLTLGSLELEGRLVLASNASFFAHVTLDGLTVPCVYKPVAGERPLWDFPDGTLAARERAARAVSEAGGWHVVPPTFLRDGRFGPGMVQQWIDVDPDARLVDVVSAESREPGWIPVVEAEDQSGDPVLLVHADDARLRDLALLDIVINNADRKGGHVLPDVAGHVWGCDHGVTFHEDVKLRTVLWGWADEPLRDKDIRALRRVKRGLAGGLGEELATLLGKRELRALRARLDSLLARRSMPSPGRSWHAIPWPAI